MGNLCPKKEEDKQRWVQTGIYMPVSVKCSEIDTFNDGRMQWMFNELMIDGSQYCLQQYRFLLLSEGVIENVVDHVLKAFYQDYVYLVSKRLGQQTTLQILVQPIEQYQPKNPNDFAQIVKFLDRIHKENLIFRGLYQENIYHKEGKIAIVGLHTLTNQKEILNIQSYSESLRMPPESMDKGEFDQAGDWWCLGALIYISSQNELPYQNNDQSYSQLQKDKNQDYKKLIFTKEIGVDEKDIIFGLLNPDCNERLLFSENIKEHNYFKDIIWEELKMDISKLKV